MAEYIERQTIIELAESISCNIDPNFPKEAVTVLANFLPAEDVVDRAAFDQVVRDRAVAMKQLKEHGIPFGGEADVVAVVRCKDFKHMAVVGVGFRWCKAWERMQTMGDEGFCCFGEKRGGDDE